MLMHPVKTLHAALVSKGHDVTRTSAPRLALDASDEFQLLWASAHDRVLFTFTIRDYLPLARRIPEHRGILLVNLQSHSRRELIALLDRTLTETQAEDWVGQVGWLSDWR